MRIELTGIGSEFQGVGRAEDGRAAFVPYALPGETVEVSVRKSADRFVECRLDEVITASPRRVEPMCPLYGRCGGCKAQHVEYDAGLRLKQHIVSQTLRRLGKLENPPVLETLGSKYPWRYRNKGEYAIATDKATNTPVIGLCEANSHRVVQVEDCLLQHPLSVQVLRAVSRWMQINCISAWDSAPKSEGGPRYLVTRVTHSGDVMAVICTTGRKIPNTGNLQDMINEETGGKLRSLYQLTLAPKPAHALDGHCRLIAGKAVLHDKLMGLTFDLSPQTFFQVNTELTEVLYGEALKAASLTGDELVLDAYCGAGTISLALAREAKHVVGVEVNEKAIENARANAERNHLADKTEFYAGDAAEVVLDLFDKGFRPDVIVVDPPRKGVEASLLEAMVRCASERIVYVSCNPATLARDLKILLADGSYQLDYAQPVDMFAHTEHVETVVLLSKGEVDSKKNTG